MPKRNLFPSMSEEEFVLTLRGLRGLRSAIAARTHSTQRSLNDNVDRLSGDVDETEAEGLQSAVAYQRAEIAKREATIADIDRLVAHLEAERE